MAATAALNSETLFLNAWMAREDLFDRLCAYNPAFKEFRRVLGNEEVARRLSLDDVAAMVDSPADDIAAIAGGRTLSPRPTQPLEGAPEDQAPDLDGSASPPRLQHLDARPIFDSGNEPLAAILAFMEAAGPADTLVIEAPFHPVPLRRLLARRGYRSQAEALAPDHWRCTFLPRAAKPSTQVPEDQTCRNAADLSYAIAAVASNGEGPTGLVLSKVAQQLQAEGHSLAGVVQIETDRAPGRLCDMVLSVLPDGLRIDITQNLGRHARGCRLDQQALEDAVNRVDRSLDDHTQLLVINKFGKRESEGAGFRQTIARAVELGIPVLLGIGATERAALETYIGEDLIVLPEDADTILAWCHSRLGVKSREPAATSPA